MFAFNQRAVLGVLEAMKVTLREAEHGGSSRCFIQLPNTFRHENPTESVFFARCECCDSCLNSLACSSVLRTMNRSLANRFRDARPTKMQSLRSGLLSQVCPPSFNPLQGPR